MKIPDKLYDILKWVVIIVLPLWRPCTPPCPPCGAGPTPEEVVTTVTAVDTFLGAVLCISTATYNKESGDTENHPKYCQFSPQNEDDIVIKDCSEYCSISPTTRCSGVEVGVRGEDGEPGGQLP